MTTHQLHLFNGLYLILSVLVAFLTHATARRISGALVGGLAVGVAGLGKHTSRWSVSTPSHSERQAA
jgi:hypothetical protein